MKRILFVTRNFPPLVGGMERLAHNIYKQVNSRSPCDLIGPAGSRRHCAENSIVYECPVRPLPWFLVTVLVNTLRASLSRRYTLCIAGSGMTALFALLAASINRAPCIVFIHGLDLVVKSRLYQLVFVPAIRRCDRVIVNSRNTAKLAAAAGIERERIIVLHPGVELPLQSAQAGVFRSRHGLQNNKLLLSVGRLIARKGIAEFIHQALPDIVSAHPGTMLVIIGDEPAEALQRGDPVLAGIQQAIASTGLEQHILLLGRVEESELTAAYTDADCLIFPLRAVAGDVEGFGMVAVEAAAHGLPTVAFDEGGVSDALEHGKSGLLVTAGDYPAFSAAVRDVLNGVPATLSAQACRAHAASFHWDTFGDKLQQILHSCTTKKASR
ncbi:MAG: glycosyltransferase family 4 protein [Gammaproteobacteria bacterium]